MKEMIYNREQRKAEILEQGEYKGHKFVILSLGSHPTAYVENKIKAVNYDDEHLNDIEVHGGFTYCREAYWNKADDTNYLGWDYTHYNDYNAFIPEVGGKRYTTEEIFEEVKHVIDQLCAKEEIKTVIDKEIKEIAKIIDNRVGTNIGQIQGTKYGFGKCADVTTTVSTKLIAETLYDAGYRKVIYRDNMDELLNEEIKELTLSSKVRKETAKEILQYIKNSKFPINADIAVLCEKYGVEIEE